MELTGKCALITGAGSGIGRGAAVKLAREGASVALLGRHPQELVAVASEIEAVGGRALILAADVADEAQMKSAFAEAGDVFGRLDFVFANAGINGTWAPIEQLTYADWNLTHSINLGGTFLAVHFAVPLMKEQGGSIAITSSINGTRTFTTAGASAYSASKAGQLAFGQMAALELARYRIRVNVICPGGIRTNIGQNTWKINTETVKVPATYPEGTIPLTKGEPGTIEDIAEVVAFLASDRSKHISGTPIWVDGAQSLLI